MDNEIEKSIGAEGSESGVLEHEASIWEVLRRSEEKIRIERKNLNQERSELEQIKEELYREKDGISKLKDDVIAEKSEAMKERERLFKLRDQFSAQRETVIEVKGRLDEQRLNLKARIDEVNQKIEDVDERSKILTEREKKVLSAADEIATKKEELVTLEHEIIEREKEIAKKTTPLLEKETELQNKERELNERELTFTQEDEKRVTRAKELTERESKLLAREKTIEEEYEKVIALRVKLIGRESRLMETSKILEAGGELESIGLISTEIGGEDMDKALEALQMDEIAPPPEEPGESGDGALDGLIDSEMESAGLPQASEPEPEPETISKEAELAELEDEMACPTCGTMISKVATTCFACGMEIKPESDEKNETDIKEDLSDKLSIESEFLEFEEKEEIGRSRIPTIEEIDTMSKEELIARCKALGLDPTGKEKNLQKRLLAYIKSTSGSEEKETPTESPAETAADKGTKTPLCSDCGSELTYIEQYSRWYCYTCEKYGSKDIK